MKIEITKQQLQELVDKVNLSSQRNTPIQALSATFTSKKEQDMYKVLFEIFRKESLKFS